MTSTPGGFLGACSAMLLMVALWAPPAEPARAQTTPRRIFADISGQDGVAVANVRADEIEVLEQGERREILSVTNQPRPLRVVLMMDSTEAISQPIGQIRRALLEFTEAIDPAHEMMFVTVSGTMQIRVRPTLDRKPLHESIANLFGGMGGSVREMHRVIDEMFHRFGQTTEQRPVFVVITAEGLESMQRVNPQQIRHLTEHFLRRGGDLHAVDLIVPRLRVPPETDRLTEMAVTLMAARDSGGFFTSTSPAGLRDVLQRLAQRINSDYDTAPRGYRIEYASRPSRQRSPAAPEVRVLRDGIRATVTSAQ